VIICLALSNVFRSKPPPQYVSYDEQVGLAISKTFNFLKHDFRNAISNWKLLQMVVSTKEYSNRGVTRKFGIATGYCNVCRKQGKEIQMIHVKIKLGKKNRNPSKPNEFNHNYVWKCPECGSDESVKVSMSPKYLKQREQKIIKMGRDFLDSLPRLEKFVKVMQKGLKDDPLTREKVLVAFNKYERLVRSHGLFNTESYFWAHYDPSKKSKRRWCPLTKHDFGHILILDTEYIRLLSNFLHEFNLFLGSINDKRKIDLAQTHDETITNLEDFGEKLRKGLTEIGWPEDYLNEKIIGDLEEIYFILFLGIRFDKHNEFINKFLKNIPVYKTSKSSFFETIGYMEDKGLSKEFLLNISITSNEIKNNTRPESKVQNIFDKYLDYLSGY
jgi:hypothetical protein